VLGGTAPGYVLAYCTTVPGHDLVPYNFMPGCNLACPVCLPGHGLVLWISYFLQGAFVVTL
jgi:hypothetical protein